MKLRFVILLHLRSKVQSILSQSSFLSVVIRLSMRLHSSQWRINSELINEFRDTLYIEPCYQILPWLFRDIDQSVLRSDAPTVTRGLPKFIERVDWSLTYFLLASIRFMLKKKRTRVIKRNGEQEEEEREREWEMESGPNGTQINRDARCDRPYVNCSCICSDV